MRRLFTLAIFGGMLGAIPLALAAESEEASIKEEAKVPWQGSTFIYENIFSAYSLSKSADLSYNPYYAQSLSFRPHYAPPVDGLDLGLRLDMEIELTTSDDTDRAHQWILSDMLFDVAYSPKLFTIPKAEIKLKPNVRFTFPTSIESRGRSLVMGIGPGLSAAREFKLLKGKVLPSLTLTYAFRGTKYFHQYALSQVNIDEGCRNINRPECQHSGKRNRSWRLGNTFELGVKILDKLTFTGTLFLMNDLIHGLPAEEIETGGGTTASLSESQVNHRALTWAIFDLTYDLFDWLALSAGTSTYYGQLNPNSTYQTPLLNRYTNIYFDVTIPVDKLVSQIQTWSGRGKGSRAKADF